MPLLGEAGVGRNINSPIPYAPLGGPMPGVKRCIPSPPGSRRGVGGDKVLSDWIIHGETELVMCAVDPRSYTDYTDHDYCLLAKALETYGHEYAMHFPHHEWPVGRDKKLSPNHASLLAAGGRWVPTMVWNGQTGSRR